MYLAEKKKKKKELLYYTKKKKKMMIFDFISLTESLNQIPRQRTRYKYKITTSYKYKLMEQAHTNDSWRTTLSSIAWLSKFKQLIEQDVYFKPFPALIAACTNKVSAKAT